MTRRGLARLHPQASLARARKLATTMLRRTQLNHRARSVDSGLLTVDDWRFIAEAGVALDDTPSADAVLATAPGLMIPRVADICILRVRGRAGILGDGAN